MCQLIHVLTILLAVGLSTQTLPFQALSLQTFGSPTKCTVPKPSVSAACQQAMVGNDQEMQKCGDSKSGFWKDKVDGAAGDNSKVLFYRCCGIEDLLTCFNTLQGQCSAKELEAIKQYGRDCINQASDGVLNCAGQDTISCPSGSHRVVVGVLSVITLFASILFMNKTQM